MTDTEVAALKEKLVETMQERVRNMVALLCSDLETAARLCQRQMDEIGHAGLRQANIRIGLSLPVLHFRGPFFPDRDSASEVVIDFTFLRRHESARATNAEIECSIQERPLYFKDSPAGVRLFSKGEASDG